MSRTCLYLVVLLSLHTAFELVSTDDLCRFGTGRPDRYTNEPLLGGETIFCFADMIVIQQRLYGEESFNRSWSEYRDGFGSETGDFWLGLQRIHNLTKSGDAGLEIEVFDNNQQYKLYVPRFIVGTEAQNFRFTYGGKLTGSLSKDAFIKSSEALGFSTYDRDNDNLPGFDCASDNKGAWWYSDCGWANLNGPWQHSEKRMYWYNGEFTRWLQTTGMKIRLPA